MKRLKNTNLDDLPKLANSVAKQLNGGETIALVGKLGSGKTTFTKLLGKLLKIKHQIISPSFGLMHHYFGKTKTGRKISLYHLDLYRTTSWKEVKYLGIEEIWQKPNSICVIEWANKIKSKLPKNTIWIELRNYESVKKN